MRNQTPIQQQRTTQTQLSRGRPHNPSLARRIQPSGQRKSPLRQMQQQTRQRTRRKRKSTPLPEKRRRTRQTTHRSHANTTHRHMVNHPPPFQTIERRDTKKDGEREREDKANNKGDAMVFGDNVRARRAARALPRTPTQRRGRERRKEEEDKRQDHTPSHTTAIPPCCDREHKRWKGKEERRRGNARGTRQRKRNGNNVKGRTQSQHGDTTHHHSRHSMGPPRKRKGDTTRKTGRPAT